MPARATCDSANGSRLPVTAVRGYANCRHLSSRAESIRAGNEQHDLLKARVNGWNKRKKANPIKRIDLILATLNSADLTDADLNGADLNGADLNRKKYSIPI